MRRRAAQLAAFALLGVACAGEHDPVICSDSFASSVADRKLLGQAAPYLPDGTLRGRASELATSHAERRSAAWKIVEHVVSPVGLAVETTAAASLPRWRTWYDRDDLTRLFHRLYGDLGPAGRQAKDDFTAAALDEAFGWNPTALDDLDTWSADRWAAYVAAIDEQVEVDGVGGIRRIALSPSAARHLLASYDEVLACRENGVPPAFDDGPDAADRRLVRQPVTLAGCASTTVGPFAVASGEAITATVETDDHATVELLRGPTAALAEQVCRGDGACGAEGPGTFFIVVRAEGGPLGGMLDVSYAAPDPVLAGCLDGRFPLDAATVIADWRRADVGWPLPTYDTSALGLARRTAAGADATWGAGDGEADPDADDIYTVRLPNGNAYRLAALHIGTRDLDEGVWITLWWAPDADQDFGADRPAALSGPWAHYKMCVATGYDEIAPVPTGGPPSLTAALGAVDGPASWCSNPYLDAAPGLAATNCIGCHQHAGSGLQSDEIPLDEAAFPLQGRVQVRNNFPHDYLWALDGAEHLAGVFVDEVGWWGED